MGSRSQIQGRRGKELRRLWKVCWRKWVLRWRWKVSG